MKKFYLIFVQFVVFIFCTMQIQAQNEIPDSKGKEFWVAFNRNYDNSSVELSLFITGTTPTSGIVELPDGTLEVFSVTPGAVTTVMLPSTLLLNTSDGIEDKGIKITATEEVTVYGLNKKPFTTDAFLALPVDILETEYIIMSYTSLGSSSFSSSLLGVVATQDATEVTIIPAATVGDKTQGVAYTITLQEGESYQLLAPGSSSDLTGTLISSTKPIAVFGGHTCANVPVNTPYCDHMIEQLPPASSWGTQFVTAPLATRLDGDIFRILAATDGTQIEINGNEGFADSFVLNRGEFRELDIASSVYTQISSSENILVAQFSKGDESDPSIVNGDPFMLIVPPLDQFLNTYTVTTPESGFNLNFINVIARTTDVGTIILDGAPLPGEDFSEIAGSNFSAAQVAISLGTHNLSGNFPFGVSVYGFADDESYGYLGGQGLGEVAEVEEISLSIEPVISQGNEYCFNATTLNSEGIPVAGIRVDFLVEGVNNAEGFAITDAEGEAQFCYTPENTGEDVITASVGNVSAQATITVEPSMPTTLTLIDSQTDTDILEIQDGGVYAIEDLPELLAIRADLDAPNIGSVVFDLKGPFSFKKTETNAPYALFGNMGNDYTGRIFPPGDYMLSATPYSEAQGKGTAGNSLVVSFSISINAIPDDLAVLGFDLYDAVSDTKIMDLVEGSIIDLGTLNNNSLSVLALTMPDFIGSLKIEMEGPITAMRIENNRPYTLFANNSINFYGKEFPNGNYHLMATPYTEANANGTAGTPLEINFEVTGTPVSEAMKVYPVPFKDYVYVDLQGKNRKLDVRLFDYLGQPVKVDAIVEADRIRVATNALNEGLYIIQIFSEEYPVKTLKVQKMR